MFAPTLSRSHRRQVSDLRARLAKALEPVIITEDAKFAPLTAKAGELAAEIAGIERAAGEGGLEEAADLLSNRKEQLRLVEGQVSALQASRDKAQQLADQESADLVDALSGEAHSLLTDVAVAFESQHREHLEAEITPYAGNPSRVPQMLNFFPVPLEYLRRIRRFREHSAEAKSLVGFLTAALDNKDFLMPEL